MIDIFKKLTEEQKLQIALEADKQLGLRPFTKASQLLAVKRALIEHLDTNWGRLVREKALDQAIPCRRCQKCGHLTSLPFTHKIQEPCLDGGEHAFKDFPNGETTADLAQAAELIKRSR